MARRATITTLPIEVREALRSRLVESGYSNYDYHSEWMKSIGFDLSKSSIHRFGQKLQAAEMTPKTPEQFAMMDLRMRALEIAVKMVPPPADILDQADELMEWVG